ncbi:uncharacterized protein QC763_208115 [Podospora pseudopauciseta]|uniref:Uncharacterized protein n=2 Tax=Podospora TaxID=5144 RepID=A0ABR0HQ24_9PEZI|nr:hypothetical protein QC763_208115 [Podospora pseudopauciseta]KAK4679882.1 hypothetical protein QC764_208115 [Podospora pseudoanserina]
MASSEPASQEPVGSETVEQPEYAAVSDVKSDVKDEEDKTASEGETKLGETAEGEAQEGESAVTEGETQQEEEVEDRKPKNRFW